MFLKLGFFPPAFKSPCLSQVNHSSTDYFSYCMFERYMFEIYGWRDCIFELYLRDWDELSSNYMNNTTYALMLMY